MADRSLVPRKQRRRAVQQRLLPGVDLAGMHTKSARQLGNRAILPDRRQRYLRLELRTVLLPCSRQVSPPAKPPSQGQTLSLSNLASLRRPPQCSLIDDKIPYKAIKIS